MLEQLEALVALAEEETMGRAAVRLRVSQSAVSKRVAALEGWLRRPLTERRGRRLVLTPAGTRLVERAGPLLAELRAALAEEGPAAAGRVVVGVSESVLGSWGAGLLTRVQEELPAVTLELHTHRSPVVMERVRGGEYSLGVCAGAGTPGAGLRAECLVEEPMVLLPAGGRRLPRRPTRRRPLEVASIEPASATWAWLEGELAGRPVRVTRTLESFFAVAQLARAGLAHALVPRGVADALGVPADQRARVPGGALARPVWLVGRASSLGRGATRAVAEELRAALAGDLSPVP
jgi:DNA-binding transcriptional LysR family regulator